MKWSKDKDKEIVNYIKEGLTYSEISDKINFSPNAIRTRCFRLGIKSSDYIKDKNKTFICLNCETEIISKIERKFCCHTCSAIYNNKLREKLEKNHNCYNCNKEIKRGNKYCSQSCQNEFEYNNYIEKWKNDEVDGLSGDSLSIYIRKYFFKKHNNKCSECGWSVKNIFTNKIPLEIDHIDGNYKNNKEENLRLLCPNCHTLTENYGSRNKGNGRPYRQKWRKKFVVQD